MGVASTFVLALALAAIPAGAAGAVAPPSAGQNLSPRLAELAKPSVRSAPAAEQAARLSVAREGPASLLREGRRVLVEVRFERGMAAGIAALQAAGARVRHVSHRYRTVTVSALPADLRSLGAVAGVAGVSEVLTPLVAATGCAGLVTSEGDAQLGAASARAGFGVDGAGVTVGILSDSFDTDPEALTRAFQDVASGDLPGAGNPCGRTSSVTRLQDLLAPGETIDEGRAMAQIVHDLAPGASLSFATAFVNELSFADNIRALANTGADVIVDDVTYFKEPFFQEGPVGVAAGEVEARGVSYFSSAGNNNLIDAEGNEISSWEAPEFRDTECPPELADPYEPAVCMDFDPGEAGEDPSFGITVEEEETLTVDLQWAEPRFGTKADLDAFLLDEEGEPIEVEEEFVGSFDNNIAGAEESSEIPVEVFSWENESDEPANVQLVINRCFTTEEEKEDEELGCNAGADPEAVPRLKLALLQNGGGVSATDYSESLEGDVVGPAIFGHNGSPHAISVGAVPFNDSSAPEPYSSRGPLTHYFGPVTGTTAAAPLASPQTITKPDLAATDCGMTTFFLPGPTPGVNQFCGTSAAAPHAAAVAALMRQANPSLTVPQIRTALGASARPVGAFGVNAVGAGLVDAFGAVGRVALPPQVRIDAAPKALSNNPRPPVRFSASRPVTFSCSIDAGRGVPCTSPFTPPVPLADGAHGFAVTGTDLAGRMAVSPTVTFTIDTRAPRTFFRARPRKVIRTRKKRVRARFRFGSNERPVAFSCRIDRAPYRTCRATLTRRFRKGRHTVRVRAADRVGNVDPSPAVYRFAVKKRRHRRSSARRRTAKQHHAFHGSHRKRDAISEPR